jgi:hypothetical protein
MATSIDQQLGDVPIYETDATAQVRVQAVQVQVQPQANVKTRVIRVYAPYGYPINVHTQGIVVAPSAEVKLQLDSWVAEQIKCGTLKEVE